MMEPRELAQRIKALQSSVAKNEPASEIISQMELLKKEVQATEEVLRTTKAGLMMGRLRQNANKDIARLASEVVSKWKKSVEQEKAARSRGGESSKVAEASPKAASSSPATKPLAGVKRKFEGNPELRHFKKDKVEITRTGSAGRDNCIGVIYNGLAYRSTESEDTVLQKAVEVEHAAYKFFNGETKSYKAKILALFQNLKNKQNAQLRESVMSGDIPVQRFIEMSSAELMSDEQRKQDMELEKENLKKAQAPMAEKSISDSLQCGNCKQKKVSYSQAQTRSADEPMTTFCECMNCGHRWKFS